MLCQMDANDVSTPPLPATPTSTICAKIFPSKLYVLKVITSQIPYFFQTFLWVCRALYMASQQSYFYIDWPIFTKLRMKKHVDKGNIIFFIN